MDVVVIGLLVLRWGIYPIMNKFDPKMALRARNLTYVYFIVIQMLMVVSSISLPFFL